MADQTIHDENVVTTAAVADELLIWRVANNDTKRITKANFIGVTITGGGTIATGGFTLTVAGNSTINGSLVGNVSGGGTLVTGGFTDRAGDGLAAAQGGGGAASWADANSVGMAASLSTTLGARRGADLYGAADLSAGLISSLGYAVPPIWLYSCWPSRQPRPNRCADQRIARWRYRFLQTTAPIPQLSFATANVIALL
jgi:hypothetical protein